VGQNLLKGNVSADDPIAGALDASPLGAMTS
jgi:hypothetical protein